MLFAYTWPRKVGQLIRLSLRGVLSSRRLFSESSVSRYDGEIGGGKEEKKEQTREAEGKKPAETWAGRKGVTSCPFPPWRTREGRGRNVRAPASSYGRDRSTRETFVQPIWSILKLSRIILVPFLQRYHELSYKCYSMDLEKLPYILAVMYGNNTAPHTRLFVAIM